MLNFWWLAAALLVSGLGIAPSLAVMYASVSASVRFSDTAEAYGWFGTGQLIGAALGSATAGAVIDGGGAFGGLIVAARVAALGVLVPVAFAHAMPDLRGRTAGPAPDTAPVPTQPLLARLRDRR